MENHQKRLKNDEKWIVWKNIEIIAIIKSWKLLNQVLILASFFRFYDVFSSISINQSQILMKKLTKSSKNVAGKKGWFYSKEKW